jgi:excisionase family DNA binding protein
MGGFKGIAGCRGVGGAKRSMMEDRLLSPKELSEFLRVSKPFPYLLARRGLIPFYKMGKVIRFKRSDIEAYLKRSRVEKKHY